MREEPPLPPALWIQTPCIYSEPLSKAAGCNIFLKLENLQPSGSFKSRGIGNLISRAAARSKSSSSSSSTSPDDRAPPPHFYCSSAGNAGLACITAAAALSLPATIVVPLSTAPRMVSKLRGLGASVHQVGASWAEADAHMREALVGPDPAAVYVPPFDHPDIWTGAATLVDELALQMGPRAVHGIVCSVGGGGLLNGIMQGLEGPSWPASAQQERPRVMAVETAGADSLNLCVRTGEHATLESITSIATSLGARKVSARSYEYLTSSSSSSSDTVGRGDRGPQLTSVVVQDWEAAMGCVRFADDARIVVEAACGATVAPVYFGDAKGRNRLRAAFERDGVAWAEHNVVLVVCGGSNVSLDLLDEYREKYSGAAAASAAAAVKVTNGVGPS